MELHKPSYYDQFHCIAGECPDTCCQLWDIQVDPETAAFYDTVPGALGDKIRRSIHREDGEVLITMVDQHCPLQDENGLCSLQIQLGEQALCQVCREFPRLHHDYGSFLELGLELSCPEAARIILNAEDTPDQISEIPGGSAPEYDQDAMAVLLSTRKQALAILREQGRSTGEILALLFFYGCHAQALLDGEEAGDFDPDASLQTGYAMARHSSFREMLDYFGQEEILTSQWAALLKSGHAPEFTPQVLPFCRYLINRYWLQAVSDYDLYCRVKFILISCLLVCSLPENFIRTAQLYSKEIENDIDNVDDLLDAAYENSLFTDDRLLGFLLKTP